MSFSVTSPQTLSIRRQLRAAVNGRVVTADNADYDQARALFYGGFDRRPQAIVWPTDTSGVAQVVSLAAERGLELAVRGGGHSSAGHSVCDGGIVLDLSELKALEIDTAQRTRRIGAGTDHAEERPIVATPQLACSVVGASAQTCTISRSTTTYPQRVNAAAIGALSTSVAATISVAPPSTSRWVASRSSSSA
jgi:FAD binding domain